MYLFYQKKKSAREKERDSLSFSRENEFEQRSGENFPSPRNVGDLVFLESQRSLATFIQTKTTLRQVLSITKSKIKLRGLNLFLVLR